MRSFENKQDAQAQGYYMARGPFRIRPGQDNDETMLLKTAWAELEARGLTLGMFPSKRPGDRQIYIAAKGFDPAARKPSHSTDAGAKFASQAAARRHRA